MNTSAAALTFYTHPMSRGRTARWMLEEFYVSLWAQELGTAKPVSLQRIKKTLGK